MLVETVTLTVQEALDCHLNNVSPPHLVSGNPVLCKWSDAYDLNHTHESHSLVDCETSTLYAPSA